MPRYPLGIDADPNKSHRSAANRRTVGYCLSIFWTSPDALADKINDRHGSSRVGMPINGRMVTRIEVKEALTRLEHEHSDWFTPIWWVYARHYSRVEAAEHLAIHEATLRERIKAGLNWLIDELWQDQVPHPPARRP